MTERREAVERCLLGSNPMGTKMARRRTTCGSVTAVSDTGCRAAPAPVDQQAQFDQAYGFLCDRYPERTRFALSHSKQYRNRAVVLLRRSARPS
jgi:hypothetical protein